jgi:transposase
MELSLNQWKLAFSTGRGRKPRRRDVQGRQVDALKWEISLAKGRFGLAEDAPVLCCYEAGRDGFWLHRYLLSEGVQNVVVDSSSIEVNRRRRRAKTDRLDAEKLLAMLIRWHEGEGDVWRTVRVPDEATEDSRRLHRELKALREEQIRHNNRIKALLIGVGIRLERVDKQLPKRLEAMRLWDGRALPEYLQGQVLREFRRMQLANEQIRELEKDRAKQIRHVQGDGHIDKVRRLMELRGIGDNSSWMFVKEVFGWRKLANRREVGAVFGLVPTPYNSGGSERDQGISKAGNQRLRSMAIEIAWCWLRFQPNSQLTKWYARRFAEGSKRQRRIGIVALARKLMVVLWRWLEEGDTTDGFEFRREGLPMPISYTRRLS